MPARWSPRYGRVSCEPVKLTISAFGPCAGRVVLDMGQAGQKGGLLIFITGDTGAGKTTIFDAIMFALYGEASGTSRQPNMLRSKYAAPDVPTEVELIFRMRARLHRQAQSRIRAAGTPRLGYDRAACRRRAGMPWREDYNQAAGSDRRDKRAARRQPRPVFTGGKMIAQGEFMRLLTEDTPDRIKIFRKILKNRAL